MKLTELERAVVERMLADSEIVPRNAPLDAESVTVTVTVADRELSGVGFLAELVPTLELKLFEDVVSTRWAKIGATHNARGIETGYLVYVYDDYLTTIEGYA